VFFVLLCIFLFIPGIFLVLFILFSVLLTIRILNLLGICLRLKLHIFYISYVGIICFGILLDCIAVLGYLLVVIFGKVHFTAVIMPNFF
jgi:hypothetical protein